MQRRRRTVLGMGVVACLLGGAPLMAQQGMDGSAEHATTELRALRVSSEVDVDGALDEPFWADAPVIDLTWEIDPGYNQPAPVRTTCRVARSDDALLLGCTAEDPSPGRIRAYVTDRDALDGQDRITVTLDPFADARRAFRFSVSALGVQGDALVAASFGSGQGGSSAEEDVSWDAIWGSAGRITTDGYGVEMSIPFVSLRFPSGADADAWRIQIERAWPRNQLVRLRNTSIDRSDGCDLCRSQSLTGLSDIEPSANVQLTPTLTASRVDEAAVESPGQLVSGAVEPELGLSGRWGITPGMTLGLTANPDFSQIEADVARLDVNNQFTLFFPERRPFFLEGADVFATPIRTVFTRTVADPVIGTKLTGKSGPWAVGFLGARDEEAPLLIPATDGSTPTTLREGATTVVGRARRDVGRSSTVGVLYSGREGTAYHNRLASVDALVRPLQSVTVRAQAMLSSTDYPDTLARAEEQSADRFTGAGLHLEAQWATRDWQVGTTINRRDADFRADAGFVPQVGLAGGNARIRRIFWGGRDRWFSRIFLEAGYWRNQEIGGPVLDGNGFWFGLFYRGPLQSELSFFPNVGWDRHFRGETWKGLNNYFASGSIQPWANVGFEGQANFGDAVDFANVRLGYGRFLSLSTNARAGRHVTLTLAHSFNRLDDTEGREIFTANVSELRGWYNFSARSFVRIIAQARWTDRRPEQYMIDVDDEERSLFLQALYSYKLNPETVFFLGYGDDREGADRLVATARTFFLKLSYAWRPRI